MKLKKIEMEKKKINDGRGENFFEKVPKICVFPTYILLIYMYVQYCKEYDIAYQKDSF